MSQVMQEKRVLPVTAEQQGKAFTFSIEEDMLPGHLDCATVFCGDDIASKFWGDESDRLRQLCSALLPEEWCKKLEFVHIARVRVWDNYRTVFKLVRTADQPLSARGRVDAALRSHGFEPDFGQ